MVGVWIFVRSMDEGFATATGKGFLVLIWCDPGRCVHRFTWVWLSCLEEGLAEASYLCWYLDEKAI